MVIGVRIEAHHEAVMAALGPGQDAIFEEFCMSLAKEGLIFCFVTRESLERPPEDHYGTAGTFVSSPNRSSRPNWRIAGAVS